MRRHCYDDVTRSGERERGYWSRWGEMRRHRYDDVIGRAREREDIGLGGVRFGDVRVTHSAIEAN